MRVAQSLILIPVFVQVALTLCVLVLLMRERVRFARAGGIKVKDIALAAPSDWSKLAHKLSNNYSNLLELPVLFYAGALFAFAMRIVDPLMLVLAVIFVASRIVHSVIHIGANRVMARFGAAIVGMIAVSAMWVLLFWRVASSGF